jgi:hypothetical protein
MGLETHDSYWARLRATLRSGFELTADERRVVCLLIALTLLGLATWTWHAWRG